MKAPQLKTLFCERSGCPASAYREQAFQELLYPHARPVAIVLSKVVPWLFENDFDFIERLGLITNWKEAVMEEYGFQAANRKQPNLLRSVFKVRVSGGRAIGMARRLFSLAPNPAEPRAKSLTHGKLRPIVNRT